MATNIVYKPGEYLPAPVPEGTKAGDPLQIGVINAVAITDRDDDGNASVVVAGGGATLTVAASTTPEFGDSVYYIPADDPTPARLDTTQGETGVLFGRFINQPTSLGAGLYSGAVMLTQKEN